MEDGYYDSYEILIDPAALDDDPAATQRISAASLLRALLDSAPADEGEWGPLMQEQVRSLRSSVGGAG